jgi:flagellar biosynthetic protein FliR
VLQRAKLLLALAVTIVMAPVLAPGLPRLPASPLDLTLLLLGEIAIGVFLGLLMRILMAALETLGMIISFQIGLATAMIFNPLIAEQGSVLGVFLVVMGVVLLFQVDLHHVMLRAALDSYSLFVPGRLPPVGDFTEVMVKTIGGSFKLAMQLAGPYLLLTTLMYVALGLLARLMPQLQVFFVALPLQLALGFLLLALTLTVTYTVFLERFDTTIRGYLAPG